LKQKEKIRAALGLAVLIIGIYMLVKFYGAALPPVLSGIAFILLGLGQLIELKK
jgi:hypothetical protein